MFEDYGKNPPSPFLKEFPEENDVYLLKEDGLPTHRVNLSRMENSQFWESKHKIIGLVLLLCGLYFVVTLLGEVKIVEEVWKMVLSYFGQFLPEIKLPF